MTENFSELNNLSDEEKALVFRILNEYSQKGSSQSYRELVESDFKEQPVDIITFIKDNNYLGKAWHLADGRCKLFPFWEEQLKKLFPDPYTTAYNNFIESGARGLGKAQPLTSKVLTDKGFLPMGNITVGTLVYGADGELHDVTHIFPQGKKPVYRVSFSDGTFAECSDEHLWTVIDKTETPVTLTLNQIKNSDYKENKYQIPLCHPINYKQSVRHEASPYSDGEQTAYSNSDYIFNKNFLYANIDERIEVVEGMFYKCRTSTNNFWKFTITTTNSVKQKYICALVQSLGGTATINIDKVEIHLPQTIKPKYVPHNKKIENQSDPVRYITAIEYKGEEECQCIMVNSSEHLYITDNYIVTHNSEIAITCGLYLMYRLMCLKNPYDYLNLKPTEAVVFAFMNVSMKDSEDIGVTKFQNTVQKSPWFMSRGTMTGINTLIWNPPKFIQIIVGSKADHVRGKAVFFSFHDEVSFARNQDIEKQKQIAIDIIDTSIGGMKTRFTQHGKNPTLLVLASSKRSDKSFLETHMKKKLETEKENVLIIDEPVWNVRPASEYSGRHFYVAQGNKFLASEVIPDGADIQSYKNRGYKVLSVPIEYKAQFRENIDRALCDYAGVSSSDLTKYIAGFRLSAVTTKSYKNLFTKELIEVGNSKDDKAEYKDFIDLSRVTEEMKSRPLFIHLDMSLSGDNTGIAGVWIKGKKANPNDDELSKDLLFKLAFEVAIKAPRGYQVSMEKNRNFIRWLKNIGFNVKGVSSDTFQSADLLQILSTEGFNTSILSVDRIDNANKICLPYHYLRNTIYEERIEIFESPELTEELLALERDTNGKIDHPDHGKYGAKDRADAVCGATYNASQHAQDFAFNYGETIETMLDTNYNEYNSEIDKMNRVFEQEIMQQHNKQLSDGEHFMDFGLGKAQPLTSPLLNDGIIIL